VGKAAASEISGFNPPVARILPNVRPGPLPRQSPMGYAITTPTGREAWRGHFVEAKQIVANLCQRVIRAAPRLRLATSTLSHSGGL
jgi:hypothetical protein